MSIKEVIEQQTWVRWEVPAHKQVSDVPRESVVSLCMGYWAPVDLGMD